MIEAGVYTLQEVLELTKLHKTKLYQLIKAGLAPAPLKFPTADGSIGFNNMSYWLISEWHEWLGDRKVARDQQLKFHATNGLHGAWFPGRRLPNEAPDVKPQGGAQ